MNVIIPILFALSVGSLAYVVFSALAMGADAYSGAYSEETARKFEDVFLFIPPRRLAEIGWACAILAFLAAFLLTGSFTTPQGFLVGCLVGTGAGAGALQGPNGLLRLIKLRRLRRFNLQLVDALIAMSNSLKAGFSIGQAIENVVRNGENPIAQEFELFLQQTRVGVTFSDALTNMEQRVGSDDLKLVVAAIEAARKTGGNLTEVFEKIASTIRERMRIENRIRTLTAQGRLQGIVVSSMPVVVIAALLIVDPALMLPFLHARVGLFVLCAVALMILTGGLMIRKIVRIDV